LKNKIKNNRNNNKMEKCIHHSTSFLFFVQMRIAADYAEVISQNEWKRNNESSVAWISGSVGFLYFTTSTKTKPKPPTITEIALVTGRCLHIVPVYISGVSKRRVRGRKGGECLAMMYRQSFIRQKWNKSFDNWVLV
jgi:hypothetical protein